MKNLVIRTLRDAAEARACGAFMAASEPWITLGSTEERLTARILSPARESHVAVFENHVAGVVVLHLDGVLNGYIHMIATHPDFRGQGIGTRMIQFAEERIFQQSPNVFLCVSSFNLRAQKLYERLGYQRVGELPGYVVPGHSEYIMRKTKGPWRDFVPE